MGAVITEDDYGAERDISTGRHGRSGETSPTTHRTHGLQYRVDRKGLQ